MKIPVSATHLALPLSLAAALAIAGCAGADATKDSASAAPATATEEVLEETEKAADGTAPYVTDYTYDVDLGTSETLDEKAREGAVDAIMTEFNQWEGCRMLSIRYAGDEASRDALDYCNEFPQAAKQPYAEAAVFVTDFHSPSKEAAEGTAWEPDVDYNDYTWYLARTADGPWQVVSCGYN